MPDRVEVRKAPVRQNIAEIRRKFRVAAPYATEEIVRIARNSRVKTSTRPRADFKPGSDEHLSKIFPDFPCEAIPMGSALPLKAFPDKYVFEWWPSSHRQRYIRALIGW